MIYIVSKLFTYTLLPPALFVWGFLLLGFKHFKKIAFSFALLLYLLSTNIVGSWLLTPLENWKFATSKEEPKYVVVLGGGYDRGTLFPTSASSTERILTGLYVARTKNLPLVFTGIEAKDAQKTIQTLQKTFSVKLPVLYEDKSLDTYQNAAFTAKKISQTSIYLVTSAYHLPRAYKLFKHFGFSVTPISCDYQTKDDITVWDLFPSMGGLKKSYIAIHEYVGLLSLILRNIDD
ncbi:MULTISPECIES: YdcF family protein [unclassified Nitratiruptor]|uniref:YdcF family protein n=1 Tax=unclassified Nitratiruptor TaxID=2624044 RepID=UPI0019154E86|nr:MULTISPECIES: YdcF family protein [unclassified Nitratiruptor]BCD59371.1 hypothetical protein NitYY0810_C0101 [Nitratiruptor sp. YY08-10]BCD63295.1 hypothetical protein NitYY0814_C0101 [Nitratiruptor sp. YY08-14]